MCWIVHILYVTSGNPTPRLDTLEEVFGKCYPVLSSGDNAEVVASVLEANFFPGILQPLTLVYRCKNYREECSTATNMCQNVNATPKDLAVRDKYWLIQQVRPLSTYM